MLDQIRKSHSGVALGIVQPTFVTIGKLGQRRQEVTRLGGTLGGQDSNRK